MAIESTELTLPQQINLYDIFPVKEQFADVPSHIELSNFLLSAAYCGNGEGALISGLDDFRNGLTQEEKGRIVLDALQQLITITTKAKNDPTITAQERSRLLHAAASLTEMCNDSQQVQLSGFPSFEIPKEVRQAIDQWGKETWKEEWAKATDKTSNFWFIGSGITVANEDYMGADFIGHCICAIKKNAISPPENLSKPWDDISSLRAFWEQHRPPTKWERLLNRIPRSPYVSERIGLPTLTTRTS